MAFDAVLEVANAFFNVLASDLFRRVLVTAVAGVTAVVIAVVAGDACDVMVTIKAEVLAVVEACRRPFHLCVALAAVAGDLLVQRICRGAMAGLAFHTRLDLQ